MTDPAKFVSGAHTWHGIVPERMAVLIFFLGTPIRGLAMALRFRSNEALPSTASS